MPPVKRNVDPMTLLVTGSGFRIWHFVVEFCWAFMIAATGLIVLRTLIVAILSALHFRRERRFAAGAPYTPPLSVIIAAYNEEKVIAATLRAVTDTSYTGDIEVLVIDDGSKDQTMREIEKAAFIDKRIRLVRQPNRRQVRGLAHRRRPGAVQYASSSSTPTPISCARHSMR